MNVWRFLDTGASGPAGTAVDHLFSAGFVSNELRWRANMLLSNITWQIAVDFGGGLCVEWGGSRHCLPIA
jgi:hypothetical protein